MLFITELRHITFEDEGNKVIVHPVLVLILW